jgi:hypothetical protein
MRIFHGRATTSIERVGGLRSWLFLFRAAMPAEPLSDPVSQSIQLAESKQMRAQASASAERPPLPSY